MSDKSGDIDELIGSLSEDLKPVEPMMHPALRVLPWVLLSAFYIGAVIFYMGVRPDLPEKLEDTTYLMDLALMGFVAISSALCSGWLCVPDMRGHKWIIGIPFTFFFVFGVWTSLIVMRDGMNMPHLHWDHCFEDGMWMTVMPAAALIFLTQRGATTRPFLMMLMNILSISALGYVGLRVTCVIDTVGHAFFMHVLPFVALGTLLGLFARKVYRW